MARRFSWHGSAPSGASILLITFRTCAIVSAGWLIRQNFFGPSSIAHADADAPMNNAIRSDECGIHCKALQNCVENVGGDIRKCYLYLDMLNQCHHGPGASTFAGVNGSLPN